MAKLKIAELSVDMRVKVTVELPASVHRDLVAYAEILAAQSGQSISEPNKLIPLMLARFMATDRAFLQSRKLRKEAKSWALDADLHGQGGGHTQTKRPLK